MKTPNNERMVKPRALASKSYFIWEYLYNVGNFMGVTYHVRGALTQRENI
jgi:hypothetical protein